MDASALPIPATDVSIFGLFWQAHWLVKGVMLGLFVGSVWVWAIVVDKIFLIARTRRAMDSFEQASGRVNRSRNSTRRCRRSDIDGGAVRRRHARVEALV